MQFFRNSVILLKNKNLINLFSDNTTSKNKLFLFFENLIADGTNGNDFLTGRDEERNTIHGYGGNDVILGANDEDVLYGDDGDDNIWAGDSDDVVEGGDGNDVLFGGNNDDNLFGNNGDDTLLGGNGKDFLSGADGDDVASGGNGDDFIRGGNGHDTLYGGDGNDTIEGGFDESGDTIYGEYGDDILAGNENYSDFLYGGDDNDKLDGYGGNDVLNGGGGNDTLYGDYGDTTLLGGDGNDLIITASTPFMTGDSESGLTVVVAGAGNDTIINYHDKYSDQIDGGADDDTIKFIDSFDIPGLLAQYTFRYVNPTTFTTTYKISGIIDTYSNIEYIETYSTRISVSDLFKMIPVVAESDGSVLRQAIAGFDVDLVGITESSKLNNVNTYQSFLTASLDLKNL
ncbi:MAG: hypothetical protein K1X44_05825 [Alphaproteobacteria bacterium]|nr:hypothetical protein [Alphaproteobacteria bacterium]